MQLKAKYLYKIYLVRRASTSFLRSRSSQRARPISGGNSWNWNSVTKIYAQFFKVQAVKIKISKKGNLAISADFDRFIFIQWILKMKSLVERQVIQAQPFDPKTATPRITFTSSLTPNIVSPPPNGGHHLCIPLEGTTHVDTKYKDYATWTLQNVQIILM